MKLVHTNIDENIVFEENKVNILCVENQHMYTAFICEMQQQTEGENGKFVFSDMDKEIKIKGNIEMITSMFDLDVNNKKFISAIMTEMKKISNDEVNYKKTVELYNFLQDYMNEITFGINIPLLYDAEPELNYLYKSMNLRVEKENGSLLENIVNYVILLSEVLKPKVICLVGLRCFLSNQELMMFYDTVLKNKINILLFENQIKSWNNDIENVIIIDDDLCEISNI